MSTLRPYQDYVRTSDLLQVMVLAGGGLQQQGILGVLDPTYIFNAGLGFHENELFNALRRHGLILQGLDLSQWNDYAGGYITIRVGANNDFAHLADTADAAVQAFWDIGYTATGQTALFLAQIDDDITYDEAQKYPAITNTIVAAQQNTRHDQLQNLPKNVDKVVKDFLGDVGNAAGSPNTWFIVGGIALLAVVVLSGKGRR